MHSSRDSVDQCPIDLFPRRFGRKRQGAAAVLGLVLMISLVILTAVVIDFGNIQVGRTQLRRAADAAAMAACWELYDNQVANQNDYTSELAAQDAANATAALNNVGNHAPYLGSSDVELGHYGVDGSWNTSGSSAHNAARVTIHRNASRNGDLELFFGALTGRDGQAMHATATAAMFNAISGFREPERSDQTLNILPLALDLESWLEAVANETDDDYAFTSGGVQSGSDGICETNLYPKGVGAPGNRGTVDIGNAHNSTSDLSRQILHGVSRQDLDDLGKPLELDHSGVLLLNGDTGISAGIKDELTTLIGTTRIIPIYTSVTDNGNNAVYTIVRWEGVRILDVKLTGSKNSKRVIIQPAKVVARSAKIDYTGTFISTHLVTPVMLVE